jgi:hypothetical protein
MPLLSSKAFLHYKVSIADCQAQGISKPFLGLMSWKTVGLTFGQIIWVGFLHWQVMFLNHTAC